MGTRSKIALEEMTAAANLSKSACSNSFRRLIRESSFSYLLRYRVEQSLPLLANPELTVTDAALAVEFSCASYYAEIFKRYLGIFTREYRRRGTEPPPKPPHSRKKQGGAYAPPCFL